MQSGRPSLSYLAGCRPLSRWHLPLPMFAECPIVSVRDIAAALPITCRSRVNRPTIIGITSPPSKCLPPARRAARQGVHRFSRLIPPFQSSSGCSRMTHRFIVCIKSSAWTSPSGLLVLHYAHHLPHKDRDCSEPRSERRIAVVQRNHRARQLRRPEWPDGGGGLPRP
jgi:hypothetical protein